MYTGDMIKSVPQSLRDSSKSAETNAAQVIALFSPNALLCFRVLAPASVADSGVASVSARACSGHIARGYSGVSDRSNEVNSYSTPRS